MYYGESFKLPEITNLLTKRGFSTTIMRNWREFMNNSDISQIDLTQLDTKELVELMSALEGMDDVLKEEEEQNNEE